MRPLVLRRASGDQHTETTSIPVYAKAVVDLREVIGLEGTILDPEIGKVGGWIDLPFECEDWLKRKVSKVYVPRFHSDRQGSLVTLHPIHAAANQLLREVEEHGRGERTERAVKGCVKMYYRQVQRALAGKNGLLGSAVFSSRMKRSGRAVVLINGDHHPEWLGVPERIFSRLALKHGDLIIIGRDPTIWHGSMEVVRARKAREHAIEMHPLLFKQMNADCDGDEVYVYKIPDDEDCQAEAGAQVLKFTRGMAKWPSFCRETNDETQPDWDEMDAEKHTEPKRKEITGFSVSPEDILQDQDGCLAALDERTGKGVAEECRTIALGIDVTQFQEYVHEQNEAQLDMKLNLGPIGAASNRLKTIAGHHADLMQAASYLSERLQQVLLDTKHTKGTEKESGHTAQDLIDLLNRRGRFHSYTLEDAEKVLQEVDVDTEIAGPMLRYLWVGYPLTAIIHKVLKSLPEARKKRYLSYVNLYICGQMSLKVVMRHIENGCKKVGHEISKVVQIYFMSRPGLNELCSTHYPLYDAISDVVADHPERCADVLKRIFVHGRIDSSSVYRTVFDAVMTPEEGKKDA